MVEWCGSVVQGNKGKGAQHERRRDRGDKSERKLTDITSETYTILTNIIFGLQFG